MSQIFEKIKIDADKIIAVASGKGGVGKSTVSVNLALALVNRGFKVGLLDADLYGPNIPLMLGLQNEQAQIKGEQIQPLERHGLKVVSVAFLTPPDQALIWRGPLANKLIEQFLKDVAWGKLDYLIIDLPPGTGDVPLSIVQKTELTGSLMVTIPSEASIADVKKMRDMFDKMKIKILGMVENMSYLICPECGVKTDLYPTSKNLSKQIGVKILSQLPFDPQLNSESADKTPFYLRGKNSIIIDKYDQLAEKIVK